VIENVPVSLLIARKYARPFAMAPIGRRELEGAARMLETFLAVGLLTSDEADSWRRWLEILAIESTNLPLAPESVRGAARAFMEEFEPEWDLDDDGGPARSRGQEHNRRLRDALLALQRLGALTWRDVEEAATDTAWFVIQRVIAAPPQPRNPIVLSTLTLFEHGSELEWYLERSTDDRISTRLGREADGGRTKLDLFDDAGTAYRAVDGRDPLYRSDTRYTLGATFFEPAPPAGATWLAVARDGAELARFPLR
jgi:hypothetical protein